GLAGLGGRDGRRPGVGAPPLHRLHRGEGQYAAAAVLADHDRRGDLALLVALEAVGALLHLGGDGDHGDEQAGRREGGEDLAVPDLASGVLLQSGGEFGVGRSVVVEEALSTGDGRSGHAWRLYPPRRADGDRNGLCPLRARRMSLRRQGPWPPRGPAVAVSLPAVGTRSSAVSSDRSLPLPPLARSSGPAPEAGWPGVGDAPERFGRSRCALRRPPRRADAPGTRRRGGSPGTGGWEMTEISEHGLVPGSWRIDRVHSQVGFNVRHMMVSRVRGRFEVFEAVLNDHAEPLSAPP